MGLLDMVGGMLGGSGAAGDPKAQLLQAALSMLQGGGAQAGGLAGLVQQFESNGLGNIVQSWIGTGSNLPISAEQLQQVLGNGTLSSLAQQSGLSPDAVSGQLSELLPGVIDKLTPNGQLPEGGINLQSAMSMLGGLLGK